MSSKKHSGGGHSPWELGAVSPNSTLKIPHSTFGPLDLYQFISKKSKKRDFFCIKICGYEIVAVPLHPLSGKFFGVSCSEFFSDRVGKSSLKGLHTRQRSSTRSGVRVFWCGRRVEIRTVNYIWHRLRAALYGACVVFFCSFFGYASPGLESDSFPLSWGGKI